VFALEVSWGTEVVVDGEEHDRFEWVSFAEALRRCRPAELAASFLAAYEALGFRLSRDNVDCSVQLAGLR
jgi:hypothetical protein